MTSSRTARATLAPALALIPSAVAFKRSSRTSPITTLAPSLANSRASAAPAGKRGQTVRYFFSGGAIFQGSLTIGIVATSTLVSWPFTFSTLRI